MGASLMFLGLFLLATNGHAHYRTKRSDDELPLTAVVQQLSARVQQVEAQLAANHAQLGTKDRQVAFRVQFSYGGGVTVPAHSPYKFDSVILNDGNGYDRTLGVFTAPVAGVYMFSAQIFTHGGHNGRPLIDIQVNGITQARLGFDADSTTTIFGEDSDSTTFVTKLNMGDRVWAITAESQVFDLWGTYHTFFSGALLYSV